MNNNEEDLLNGDVEEEVKVETIPDQESMHFVEDSNKNANLRNSLTLQFRVAPKKEEAKIGSD